MEKQTIGRFIATLRKANGYTQAQLAEKLCVSDKAVSRWERDETAPDLSLIPVIAELFGITCDELLRGQRSNAASEEAPAAPQRSKHLRQLLKKSLTAFQIRSTISRGIALLGLIAALIVNFAFLRSQLAFFIGCVFYAASAICQWCFHTAVKAAAEEEEFEGEALQQYHPRLQKIAMTTYFIIILLFGATTPLLLASDAYMGLTAASWFQYGILSISAFLVLLGVFTPKLGGTKASKEDRRFLMLTALVMAILLAVYWCSGILILQALDQPVRFDNIDDFVAYMEKPLESGSTEMIRPIPQDAYYYDENGNEITEDKALRHDVTEEDGTLICSFRLRNKDVSMWSYEKTGNASYLFTVNTFSSYSHASFVATEIQGMLLLLFPVAWIILGLAYRKKHSLNK